MDLRRSITMVRASMLVRTALGSGAVWTGCKSVRMFGCFTADLHALANWLERCGIKTVAMESTGVYWIAHYEVLESRGFKDARRT
jgi:hypothetical protein